MSAHRAIGQNLTRSRWSSVSAIKCSSVRKWSDPERKKSSLSDASRPAGWRRKASMDSQTYSTSLESQWARKKKSVEKCQLARSNILCAYQSRMINLRARSLFPSPLWLKLTLNRWKRHLHYPRLLQGALLCLVSHKFASSCTFDRSLMFLPEWAIYERLVVADLVD